MAPSDASGKRKPKVFRKHRSIRRWRDKQQDRRPASKSQPTRLLIKTSQTTLCTAPVKQWETEPMVTSGTEQDTPSDRHGMPSASGAVRLSAGMIRARDDTAATLIANSSLSRVYRAPDVVTAPDGSYYLGSTNQQTPSLGDASAGQSEDEPTDRDATRLGLPVDFSKVSAVYKPTRNKPMAVPSSRPVDNVREAFRNFLRFVHGQRESDSATTCSSSNTSDSESSVSQLRSAHNVLQQASTNVYARLNDADDVPVADVGIEGSVSSSCDARQEALNARDKLSARVSCDTRQAQVTNKEIDDTAPEVVPHSISSDDHFDRQSDLPSVDPLGRRDRTSLHVRNASIISNAIHASLRDEPDSDLSQEELDGYVANDDTSSERVESEADSESTVLEIGHSDVEYDVGITDVESETAVDYEDRIPVPKKTTVDTSDIDESGVDGYVTVMEHAQDDEASDSVVAKNRVLGPQSQDDAGAAIDGAHQPVHFIYQGSQQDEQGAIPDTHEADSVGVDIDALIWEDDTSEAESHSSVHRTTEHSEEEATFLDQHDDGELATLNHEVGEQDREHRQLNQQQPRTNERLPHNQNVRSVHRVAFGRLSPVSIVAGDSDDERHPPGLLGDEVIARAGSIDADSDSVAVATDNDDVAADETVVIRLEDELSNRMISRQKAGEEGKGVLRDVEDIWQEISGFAKNTPRHYAAQMSPIICFPAAVTPVKRKRTAGVSRALFPPIAETTFGLFQEKLWKEPFWLLIVTTFLNKTSGHSAAPIFWEVKRRYPTPEDLARAKLDELVEMIRVLGLQRQRALRIIKMAQAWCRQPPQSGEMYRVIHYPFQGDGKEYERGRVDPAPDRCVGAIEIGYMPGCGPYAYDSWRIFCRDVLRGLAQDFNGLGSRPGFEPEWKRVQPLDKELRPFLRWMWLKEGWLWDAATGRKRRLTKQEQEIAVKGEVEPPEEEEERVVVAAQRSREKQVVKQEPQDEEQRPSKKPRRPSPQYPPRTPSPSRRRSSRLHQ